MILQILYVTIAALFFIIKISADKNMLEHFYTETVISSLIFAVVWPISLMLLLWELWKEWQG